MYDRSIEIDQNIPDTYYNKGKTLDLFLGIALRNYGKYNEAVMMFDLNQSKKCGHIQ